MPMQAGGMLGEPREGLLVVPRRICRPISNANTLWLTPDYTRLDATWLAGGVPSFAQGIAATGNGDDFETQRYNLRPFGRSATSLTVYAYAAKTSGADCGISFTINGVNSSSDTLVMPTSAPALTSVEITGSWPAADFAAQFRLNLAAPDLPKLGGFQFYGLYVLVA